MSYFKNYYKDTIVKHLIEKLGYKNVMQVPKVKKIVLNMGVGKAVLDKKVLEFAVNDMTKIAGQKPVITLARESISNFKSRKGYPIGCKVTLRAEMMYEFLYRLITISIPRIRDFRGFSANGFDKFGNYNFGIREQIVFPEIDYDKIDQLRGLNITIVTDAKSKQEALELLKAFGFPFKDVDSGG